jgi:ABC-type multidrug transport system permease subunit
MGIGLILGSFVKNGKSAALISLFVAFTMMMLGNIITPPGELSGSIMVPNSYAVDAVRNIMLYGKSTIDVIGVDLLLLTVFGMITITIGLISFNRKYAIT